MHQTPTLNVQFTLSPNPEFPEKEIPSQSTSQDSFQPPDLYIEDINRGQDQPMASSQLKERTDSQAQSSQQHSPSIQQFEPDLAKRYSFDIQDGLNVKRQTSPKGNPHTKSHKSHKTVEQSLQHDIHKIERTITKNYNFYTFLVTCEFIVSAAMIVFVFYAELEQVEIILSFLHSFLMIPACFLALIAKHTYNSSKQVGVFCVFMCSTALCIATIVLAAFYLIDETYLQITTLTKCENIGDPSKDDDNYCEVFDPSLASEYHGDTLATLIAVSVQFIIGNSLVVSAWVLLRLMRKREGFIAEIKAKSKYPM